MPKDKHHHVDSPHALQLQGVYVHFDGRTALEDINLQIEPGMRVAVVGPNGAGKSTLFNALAGLLAPSSGSVRVHGHLPAEYLCLAYVPQNTQLDWSFPVSVRDVVMMGRTALLGRFRWPSAADKQQVARAMNRVQLADLAGRQVGQLSGGQRQRMFIARALAQQAELLLLDEPLAGLDIPSQEQIMHILDELKADGLTVLVATHDMELAANYFDRIVLLNRRLVAYGGREVLSEKNLSEAFGGHLHTLETPEGRFMIGDIGGHHGHEAPHA